MELSKKETNNIKGLAILFLVFLHLFNTKNYLGDFQPIILLNGIPLVYYLSLVSGCCVSLYLFCSGYGLASIEEENRLRLKSNLIRIIKLLINYWVILIIFVFIGYLIGNDNYPGSMKKFILNFLLLSKSYDGAWWFLQTYVILVLLSKIIINLVKKTNSYIVFGVSGLIYFITFVILIKINIKIENEMLNIVYNAVINLFSCQFSFILGIIFIKEKVISKLRECLLEYKYRKLIVAFGFIMLLIINIIIENFIIDPITAIVLIMLLSVTRINKSIERMLIYLSSHSTNIWLTHMFFYMIFFKELVYLPKYPLLIFTWLIILCLAASYIIKFIYKNVLNLVIRMYIKLIRKDSIILD